MPLISRPATPTQQAPSPISPDIILAMKENLRSRLRRLYQLVQQLTQKKSINLFPVADIIFASSDTSRAREGKTASRYYDISLLEKIFVHNELLNPDEIIPYIEKLKKNINNAKNKNESIFPDVITEEDPVQKEISAIAKNLDEILELSSQLKQLQLSER